MTTDELLRQNELADQLLAKLQQVKNLWDELPNDDCLDSYVGKVGDMAESLEKFRDLWNGHELPNDAGLEEYARNASSIAESLERAKELKEQVA